MLGWFDECMLLPGEERPPLTAARSHAHSHAAAGADTGEELPYELLPDPELEAHLFSDPDDCPLTAEAHAQRPLEPPPAPAPQPTATWQSPQPTATSSMAAPPAAEPATSSPLDGDAGESTGRYKARPPLDLS